MKLKELLKFIEMENKRIRKRYPNLDKEKVILAQTVKINEELGELYNEILKHCSLQRKEKLADMDKKTIDEEFSDVLITTLLLANRMDVDIEKALKERINKINKRYENFKNFSQ
jgi:NTP pyrophosphatase (non-canonical NTP hydrolase)